MAATQQSPQLTLLPDPPLLTDDEDTYNVKADETVIAQQQMIPEINASLTWIGQQVTAVDGYRQAAATSAGNAADSASAANSAKNAAAQSATDATNNGKAQVNLAKDQVTLAQQAAAAAQSAAQAAGAAAGLPGGRVPFTVLQISAQGNVSWGDGLIDKTNALPGQALMLGAAKAPKWDFPGLRVGDLLQTSRNPGALFLPAGGIYLQSAYPALFATVGLIGADAFVSWSALTTQAAAVNGIDWGRNNIWIAACNSGVLLRSTNNGDTFNVQITISGTPAMTAVATDRNGVWIAVGSNGTVYRSTDDGASWVKVSMPGATTQAFYDIACDKNGVWLIAGASNVYRSSDNGATWVAVTMPAPGPYLGVGTDENLTFLVSNDSNGGNLNTSFNRGVSFTNASGPTAFRGTDFAYDKVKNIWYGSFQDAGMYQNRALGSGGSWTSSNGSGGSQANSLIGLADGALVKVGTNSSAGSILRSVDDGYSFTTVTNPVAGTPKSLASKPDGTAVFGTSSGGMAKSVKSYNYDTTTQFKLPNPLPVTGLTSYIKALEAA